MGFIFGTPFVVAFPAFVAASLPFASAVATGLAGALAAAAAGSLTDGGGAADFPFVAASFPGTGTATAAAFNGFTSFLISSSLDEVFAFLSSSEDFVVAFFTGPLAGGPPVGFLTGPSFAGGFVTLSSFFPTASAAFAGWPPVFFL